MADEKEMIHLKPSDIKYATPEEIAQTTESVIGIDKTLNQANNELTLLKDALDSLASTKNTYDERSDSVRKRMQKLATKL